MRQRVAIARALVSRPGIILADEAFGHLDEALGAELRAVFFDLARELETTVLSVTHAIDEALQTADRILVFAAPGRLITDLANEPASPEQTRRAQHEHIRELLEGAV